MQEKSTVAPVLLKTGVLVFGISLPFVFGLSVGLGQEPAWPLRNVSQYADHVPAVWVFRVSSTCMGYLCIHLAVVLKHRAQWALLFVPTGICIAGAGVISYSEPPLRGRLGNPLHVGFAFGSFILMGVVEACAARAAWSWSPRPGERHPLFRSSGRAPWPRLWAAGAVFVCLCVLITGIAQSGAVDLDRQVTRTCLCGHPAHCHWSSPLRPPRFPHQLPCHSSRRRGISPFASSAAATSQLHQAAPHRLSPCCLQHAGAKHADVGARVAGLRAVVCLFLLLCEHATVGSARRHQCELYVCLVQCNVSVLIFSVLISFF
jgi:hypothetical protein